VRSALGEDRHGQREQRPGGKLHGGDGRRITPRQQARLDDDDRGGQDRGDQYEQVARRGGATASTAGGQPDPDQSQEIAGQGHRAGDGPAQAGTDECDQHRDGAYDQGGVADTGVLDADVLKHDHRPEADCSAGGDPQPQSVAQTAAADQRQQGGGDGEAANGQPARTHPGQSELRQGNGEAP
jgi:hypothetical protein